MSDLNEKSARWECWRRRTWFQSVEDVENAIEELPMMDFRMQSKGHLDTIGTLAKVAQDASWKAIMEALMPTLPTNNS